MKIFASILMIWVILNSTGYSSALVSDDECSMSDCSYFSECSIMSENDILAYRVSSFKSLDFIIQSNGIEASQQSEIKQDIENFYALAGYLLSHELSRDQFNNISNLQQSINNKLFLSRGGFFCNRIDLKTFRDAIVDDLDTMLDIIESRVVLEDDDT
ncbi:MAG: hypothetical protein AB8G05_24005 [Oligoflexales bacterium]